MMRIAFDQVNLIERDTLWTEGCANRDPKPNPNHHAQEFDVKKGSASCPFLIFRRKIVQAETKSPSAFNPA